MKNPFELFNDYLRYNPLLITCSSVDENKRIYTTVVDRKDFNEIKFILCVDEENIAIKNININKHVALLFYFEQHEQIQIRVSASCILQSKIFIKCIPLTFEFWIGNSVRLHKRYFYTLSEKNEWIMKMLYP